MKKQIFSPVFLFLLFSLCLFCTSVYAQKDIFLKVNYLKPEGGFSQTQEAVIDLLIAEFQDRGYKIAEKPEWQILVGIYHQEGNTVLITYTIMQTLPKPIIEFGAKNQVFYLMMNDEKGNGEKNQEIRENFTADFLHQFAMLIDIKYKIVDESDLNTGIKTIVEDIDSIIGVVVR